MEIMPELPLSVRRTKRIPTPPPDTHTSSDPSSTLSPSQSIFINQHLLHTRPQSSTKTHNPLTYIRLPHRLRLLHLPPHKLLRVCRLFQSEGVVIHGCDGPAGGEDGAGGGGGVAGEAEGERWEGEGGIGLEWGGKWNAV